MGYDRKLLDTKPVTQRLGNTMPKNLSKQFRNTALKRTNLLLVIEMMKPLSYKCVI